MEKAPFFLEESLVEELMYVVQKTHETAYVLVGWMVFEAGLDNLAHFTTMSWLSTSFPNVILL